MSENEVSTDPSNAADALEDKVATFRRQPGAVSFVALRQELRDAGRSELVAELCALWAPHESDPMLAANAWSEAGEAMLLTGQTETAIEYLRSALELDPTNDRAADRLLEIVEPEDPARAVEILENELAELAKREVTASPELIQRRASHHSRAATLWNDHLGRVDRALWHFQQAWRLEPHNTEPLEAARELYHSLGDDAMVSTLLKAELQIIGDEAPPAHKARIHLELGRLAASGRAADLEAAAAHLEQAARFEPQSLEIAEALAEVYSTPGFRSDTDQVAWRNKAGDLYIELGRNRLARQDDVSGINYLRRAVGVDPYAPAPSDALEEALATTSQWDELDRMLRHRSAVLQDPAERQEVLRRRAALYRNQLPNRDGLREVLQELVAYEAPGSKHVMELKELLRDDQDWDELYRLMEAEIAALGQDPQAPSEYVVHEVLELATIAREHLGDRDRAAELLHQALTIAPSHAEALARYVDHFRERRDWRGLIELHEFALDNAREAGATASDLVRRLEEIAQLAELRLGDIPRAIDAWHRIAELEPESQKVADAMRRLTARSKMWEQLVASLQAEIASARDPISRLQALKKMAHTYRERQLEPQRTIDLYEQILAESPGDEATLKTLAELYEKEGDDAGYAHTLRRQIDNPGSAGVRSTPDAGVRSGVDGAQRATEAAANELPIAKRSERLAALRRLAVIYETRLADVEGVVYACNGILALLPGDRDALERMERVLDKANDPRLEQTLETHAASSANPAERAKLLKRLATLAVERGDHVRALERWEQTLRASPSDRDALAALTGLYESAERWPELAQVLARIDGGRPLPVVGTPEAALRAVELERYAAVVDQRLNDPDKATAAWSRVLELTPKNRTALDALTRLYRARSRWRELADVLGQQIAVYVGSGIADDIDKAASIAMERAVLFERRLGAPGEAMKVLDALIRTIHPNHLEAHAALRRLHESRGDFDAAVRIAEREMYITPNPERKVALGLEIGSICRDRLGNPTRALQAFLRVLELEPMQQAAITAAAELLAKQGRWKEHVAMLKRLHQIAKAAPEASAEQYRVLAQRIAGVTADKLGDPRSAFEWLRRTHDEAPDERTLADIRRTGEDYGLWRELADALAAERARYAAAPMDTPVAAQRFVALSRELADLLERRLSDKQRALEILSDTVPAAPRDAELLRELERLATEIANPGAMGMRAATANSPDSPWPHVLNALGVAIPVAAPAERVELYLRRARILDEETGDPHGAVADALAAFSWAPDRGDIREVLEALAPKAGAWNELVAVDSALIERAPTTAGRVALLRRKAHVVEEHLRDAPRAFRLHLVALWLAPDDADTNGHLWRLATAIGNYQPADQTPRAEPAPAPLQSDEAIAQAVAATPRPASTRIPRPAAESPPLVEATLATTDLTVGDSTQPLELPATEDSGNRDNRTMKLSVSDLEIAEAGLVSADNYDNRTMKLSVSDLVRMSVASPPPIRPAAPGSRLPAPPPRPPQITPQRARGGQPSAPPPTPSAIGARKPQAAVRRPPLPTLPTREYQSPWEEIAVVYDSLPAPDSAMRLRWQLRASEVWESGARDIPRAFATLARAFGIARRDPHSEAEVRARLHRIASEHGEWERLADLYENLAESAETALAAADLLTEVANIRYAQHQPRQAEVQLRRILGMLPNDAAARARLEELYRSESRWVELAASLEERTDPRLGTAAPEVERPQLLRELASIYTDKIQRPHDAIDAFERLRHLAPADTTVLFKLAELYGVVGRWSKVIETLAKVSEVAEANDTSSMRPHGDGAPKVDESQAAQRQIAQIYEQELELPERAIDAYVRIVATWPDDEQAWAALDRLYETHARWNELADTLRRRAGLSRGASERAQLLSRRAAILLNHLDLPEEAAATLGLARTLTPDDPQLADQLVAALVRAGRAHEAAGILEERIAALRSHIAPSPPEPPNAEGKALDKPRSRRKKTMPPPSELVPPAPAGRSKGDLAALYIRLAQLRKDALNDRDGARSAIDDATALVPEHPTALAIIAQLSSPDDDPRAFADAKLREAELSSDEDVKIAALMAAGEVLQSRVGDLASAQGAYERVLNLRPYHADATWALAGLSEKDGDADAAMRLLENKLEDAALMPSEKARVLTQLAALSRAAGVTPASERRLLEALAVVPDHLPAIIALVDSYVDAERWNDVDTFLHQVLDGNALAAAPPALVADLHRRLATAHEQLGRDEEAYQTLVAADRLDRGHLLIKLAIGENRYKARRWREAALHLSPLAGHDEANRYPAEVAQGLYHAALAEIRSLRADKAPALYERALELKPNFTPALQALAEIAMEQGDPKRAAELLARQAAATEDPNERLRLFESLGDLALSTLNDDQRATEWFAAAVGAAKPLEAKHVALLEKLLARQNHAGDLPGAARTAELMASFGTTPAQRAALHLRAAYDYLAAGDRVRARAASERALDNDPYDVGAVDLASQLAIEQADVDAAAGMLTRLLSAKDERVAAIDAKQRALMAYRLGHARSERGDTRQAIPAFEQAIALAPDSEGATLARRALIDLAKHPGDTATSTPNPHDEPGTVASHFAAITASTGALHDLIAWSDELRREKKLDPARATLELAIACGHSPDPDQRQFLDSHPLYAMRDDEPYKASVDDRALLCGGEPQPLAQIAATLADAAQHLWPSLDEAFERLGYAGAVRVPSSSHAAAVSMFPRLTTALSLNAVQLYMHEAVSDILVVAASTPVIVLGPRLASEANAVAATEVRALVGRAVELCRPEHLAIAGLSPADAAQLVIAIARLFGSAALRESASMAVADEDVQRVHDDLVKAALPVKLRKRFEQQLAGISPTVLDTASYLSICHRNADRAALLIGGDAESVVACARARSEPLDHLIRAIAQPGWLALRTRLGVGIRD